MTHPLIAHIQSKGAIGVDEYMRLVLMHPEYGYYQKQKAIGAAGDFITAPEISQIFGEMVGVWAAEQWINMGKPECALVELGPGRGTLMKDVLRATKHVEGFHENIEVHMIEASVAMKNLQRKTLAGEKVKIEWCEYINNLPRKPLLIIANEFFDALPICQYEKVDGKWFQRVVCWNEEKQKLDFTHRDVLCDLTGYISNKSSDFSEIGESSNIYMDSLSYFLEMQGGAMLIIDYGYTGGSVKDTLQAVKKHAYVDVLDSPGEADITAHVDFDVLVDIAKKRGLHVEPILTQGTFLLSKGAQIRAEQLCKPLDGVQKKSILDGLSRLTSPEQMGTLFKVLICSAPLVSLSGKL